MSVAWVLCEYYVHTLCVCVGVCGCVWVWVCVCVWVCVGVVWVSNEYCVSVVLVLCGCYVSTVWVFVGVSEYCVGFDWVLCKCCSTPTKGYFVQICKLPFKQDRSFISLDWSEMD